MWIYGPAIFAYFWTSRSVFIRCHNKQEQIKGRSYFQLYFIKIFWFFTKKSKAMIWYFDTKDGGIYFKFWLLSLFILCQPCMLLQLHGLTFFCLFVLKNLSKKIRNSTQCTDDRLCVQLTRRAKCFSGSIAG